ncbi:MAG: 50S ribosomal protein L9 [Bacteroidota bacterium]
MKIILRKDYAKLGKVGEIVEVKDGFARNYLIPNKYAYTATPSTIKIIAEEKKQQNRAENKLITESEKMKIILDKISVTIPVKVGEDDKLFGSVTSQMIAEAVNLQGVKIDKRTVQLEEQLRTLGVFEVPIKLHTQVTATIKVWVVKE